MPFCGGEIVKLITFHFGEYSFQIITRLWMLALNYVE